MTLRRAAMPAALVTVVGLPILALVVRAFAEEWRAPALLPQRWGLRAADAVAGDPGIVAAMSTSAVVAVVTTVVALVLAFPAARVLGERRLRHPGPLFVLLALPLLAHLTMALPYAVLVLIAAFSLDLRHLEEMGRATGLSGMQRLRWVTLPTIRPTLAAASLLTFLVSWSQYGTSLGIAPGQPTLPVIMLPYIGNDPQVAATLVLLFLAPALVAVATSVRAMGRRA